MSVRFSKKWFNPLYFILNDILKDTTIRTVLIYGGKSSSKTVSICQLLAKEAVVKERSSITFRKESNIIQTTLKKSFDLAIDKTYLGPAFKKLEFSYRAEASEIVMKGLDDEEKAKGIESYVYVYLDELNHFHESEYDQFNLSLRGIPGQKLFGSWNPVDENSWVKTKLVDKYIWEPTKWKLPSENSFVKRSSCGKVILIKTTYEDNYWITGSPCGTYGYRDENLIAEYKALETSNANSYKVNVLGEWGKVVFGGEFLKKWKTEKHTGLYPYNLKQAIYLYFDENVNPYFPCGFFQVGPDQMSPRLIHSIAAENPDNTVGWMCREIERKLRAWGHIENLYIGGDATSQKADVKQEKGHDLYALIMGKLEAFNPIRKTTRSNPSVKLSADFFNAVLAGDIPGLSFAADKSNRTAILDYENTKENKDGGVDKKMITNPKTKISYQPYGHFVDLTRYFLVNTYADEYLKYCNRHKKPPSIIWT